MPSPPSNPLATSLSSNLHLNINNLLGKKYQFRVNEETGAAQKKPFTIFKANTGSEGMQGRFMKMNSNGPGIAKGSPGDQSNHPVKSSKPAGIEVAAGASLLQLVTGPFKNKANILSASNSERKLSDSHSSRRKKVKVFVSPNSGNEGLRFGRLGCSDQKPGSHGNLRVSGRLGIDDSNASIQDISHGILAIEESNKDRSRRGDRPEMVSRKDSRGQQCISGEGLGFSARIKLNKQEQSEKESRVILSPSMKQQLQAKPLGSKKDTRPGSKSKTGSGSNLLAGTGKLKSTGFGKSSATNIAKKAVPNNGSPRLGPEKTKFHGKLSESHKLLTGTAKEREKEQEKDLFQSMVYLAHREVEPEVFNGKTSQILTKLTRKIPNIKGSTDKKKLFIPGLAGHAPTLQSELNTQLQKPMGKSFRASAGGVASGPTLQPEKRKLKG